jgi:hypothetical protein
VDPIHRNSARHVLFAATEAERADHPVPVMLGTPRRATRRESPVRRAFRRALAPVTWRLTGRQAHLTIDAAPSRVAIMADETQVRILKQGVKAWNDWRIEFDVAAGARGAKFMPDLREADFAGADLSGANLSGADLWGANITGANLSMANLWATNLGGTRLHDANLSGANLSGSIVMDNFAFKADWHDANLSGRHANQSGTTPNPQTDQSPEWDR